MFALPAMARSSHSDRAQLRSSGITVAVTATEFKFKLSRAKVPLGNVTFRVTNRGKIGHDFKIAGKKTPVVKSGKTVLLTVTFKKSARYAYLCTVLGHAAAGMKGSLAVGTASPAPPPKPGTTTVVTTTTPTPAGAIEVDATEWAFALSQTTAKAGATVVFDLINKGQIAHNFAFPQLGVSTPNIDPGQSVILQVTFSKPGNYAYVCTLPQHADFGMAGTFVVT